MGIGCCGQAPEDVTEQPRSASGIALSVLVAHLSWVLVESRALRYAKRFRPGPDATAPATPVLASGEVQAEPVSVGRRAD